MKILKAILLTLILISATICTSPVLAEHSIGFAAGSTRGMGATYRFLPDPGSQSPWGWQVTGLPFITKGWKSGMISAGGAALWLLHRGNVGLAYASFGIGTIAMWNNCADRIRGDLNCEEESNFGLGLGPGIGFELRLVENFGWSVDVPLAILFANGEFEGVYPIPNSALVYYW